MHPVSLILHGFPSWLRFDVKKALHWQSRESTNSIPRHLSSGPFFFLFFLFEKVFSRNSSYLAAGSSHLFLVAHTSPAALFHLPADQLTHLLTFSLVIPSNQIIMQLTSITQLLAVALMAIAPVTQAAPVRLIQYVVWFKN